MAKRRHKKPPQGTQSIESGKRDALTEYVGNALAVTAKAISGDPQIRALQDAKRDKNHAEMARLIAILKPKYGQQEFEKIFRNL